MAVTLTQLVAFLTVVRRGSVTAAAEELVVARDEALRGMRQSGVDVLDTSPCIMTAAVINRYLQLKARASL